MSNKPPPRKKRRTREHVIEDLSFNCVERHIFLCGYSVERIAHDYGIDLMMHTYDDKGEVEPGRVFFQLKATDQVKWARGGQALTFTVAVADLLWWLREPMPVILIVYDAPADVAYWLYIQHYFAKKKADIWNQRQQTVTVRLPRTNQLSVAIIKLFAQHKQTTLDRLEKLSHDEH